MNKSIVLNALAHQVESCKCVKRCLRKGNSRL